MADPFAFDAARKHKRVIFYSILHIFISSYVFYRKGTHLHSQKKKQQERYIVMIVIM